METIISVGGYGVARTSHPGSREALPRDKQYEILDHANRLRDPMSEKKPLRTIKGLWADLDIHLSAGDIDAVRDEMWANFPRNDL